MFMPPPAGAKRRSAGSTNCAIAAARGLSVVLAEQVHRVPARGSYAALVSGEPLVHIADVTDTDLYRSGRLPALVGQPELCRDARSGDFVAPPEVD
jgi:hypothetical protein